jgi:hypothetical protein
MSSLEKEGFGDDARKWPVSSDGTTINHAPFGLRGSPVTLNRIDYLNEIDLQVGSYMDDLVVFATPVPEPGTLAMSSIATVGSVAFWRRR